MTEPSTPTTDDSFVPQRAVVAIRTGDVDELRALLAADPALATIRVGADASAGNGGDGARTLLHVATDWPGHFPNAAETVRTLVAAGADPNARFRGAHTETPLHWAASSDDVAALDALLDLGADIDADGAVIGGGTPLLDATAFGQWNAARRLVERGAAVGLWEAAALGMIDRFGELVDATSPSGDDLTHAFWAACHGGQMATAVAAFELGADLDRVGYDHLTALDAAERSEAGDVVDWLRDLGARRAAEISEPA